jgi:DNA repair protein RadC
MPYHKYTLKESSGDKIQSPALLFEAVKDAYDPLAECLYVLIMDNQNRVIKRVLISRGSLNVNAFTPSDIFRTVLIMNGNSFCMAHNHPSGDVTPSREDIACTKKIIECAKLLQVNIHDHLIFTETEYYSMREKEHWF